MLTFTDLCDAVLVTLRNDAAIDQFFTVVDAGFIKVSDWIVAGEEKMSPANCAEEPAVAVEYTDSCDATDVTVQSYEPVSYISAVISALP